uniref:Putative secreted peptide n=1 Tax=Triatoma infestans TaxID=30076 RepID=A0A023FAQ1_TRIIF
MKLNISILSVALITVFLTVCMFDSGEAICSFICSEVNSPVCGERGSEQKTFKNRCKLDEDNDCGGSGGGWNVKHQGACR